MIPSTPLNTIPSIKKFHLDRLKKLGIVTAEDLLRHFPTRYEDFSLHVPIADVIPDTRVTVEGIVRNFSSKKSWRKKLLISEATLADETGSIRAIWFGQKFLGKLMAPGKVVRLSGRTTLKNGELFLSSPECEPASKTAIHTASLVPIYPETEGLTSKWLRWQIRIVLSRLRFDEDPVPEPIRQKLHLPSQRHAFVAIHTPRKKEHYQLAQKYFAFEEMFFLQLFLLRNRQQQMHTQAPIMPPSKNQTDSFLATLPFPLTQDQNKAITHILADLARPHPMNRLLNGDVGSGKTVVAAVAAHHVARAQFQAALLAPTEVLALQHFHSFSSLLENEPVSTGLFTNAYQYLRYPKQKETETLNREKMKKALSSGLVDIVIGTHALLQKDIVFKNLALVIVDEQHRFGVAQRACLTRICTQTDTDSSDTKDTETKYFAATKKDKRAVSSNPPASAHAPHLLSMTATPIPRTLSLAFFGNLDVSLLETMPKNRLPVITRIVEAQHREQSYAFIRSQIASGRQAYVILPFVEESDAFENVKAAVTECERLQKNIFPDLALGLLHGRLKAKEKESVMRDFKNRKISVLVATSVVEVGVDVPNATVMIIENADRFGLSQLHQFRGRIGRGTHQSYCFLFASDDAENPSKRMRILETTTSGFSVAEEDLKLRGPGQFLGSRQSGLPDIAMESMGNLRLITIAKEEAETLLATDPDLHNNPVLHKKLTLFETEFHPE